jgi:hypothetical protein
MKLKLQMKNTKKISGRQKGALWSLFFLLFALSTLYVYYVNTAALNGVRWKEAKQSATALQAEVSQLESSYLSLKKGVTLARASDLGFINVPGVVFLKGAPKVSLSTE